MKTKMILVIAAMTAWAFLLPGAAEGGDLYRRQTIVNTSGSNANDLHIVFDYNVWGSKVRPKDQPPGQDGDGTGSGEGGMCGRTWDFAPPSTFGTVGPGGVAYLDYHHSCPLGEVNVDASKSYWTLDGVALSGFAKQGWPMSIDENAYDQPTAMTVTNNSSVPVKYDNVQVWRDNQLANWNVDAYFLPTGVPEVGLPTTFTLDPDEQMHLPVTPGTDYTYVLVTMESRPDADPTAEATVDYLAVRSGPPDARLGYNCVTGQLTMDTDVNVLNGFVIHSEYDGFTGTAVLPPGFTFNTNSEDTIASQLDNTLVGVHDFGTTAIMRGVLWNVAEGRWDSEHLSFTYTVEGVESVFYGDIELTGELPGDTNADGLVDAWDIQRILAANVYETGTGGCTWEQGDFNGDGFVDPADILMVLDHGQYDGAAGGMLAALVPEPASLIVLACGALGLLRRGKRQRRT